MADEAAAEEVPITFSVKSSNDAKHVVTLPLSLTVLELKTKLAGSDYVDIPPERQRLIYSGRVLKDENTLSSYKIKEGNTIHLVKAAASNQRQNPTSSSTAAAGSGEAPPPTSTGVPSNLAAGTGNNPLAGLTGARYAGFAQLPGAGMFGPDGGMGPPPDPEHMLSLLENPQFASTMNEALQNPQVIDQMIQANPLLRNMGPQVRQAMQDPNFRRMMTDPAMMRQVTQISRQFGLGGSGLGGGGGAFPAPGVTDTTPGQAGERDTPAANPTNPAVNPFAILNNFGNDGTNTAGVGAAAPLNPFAALFHPNLANPAANPPSQTQGNLTTGTTAGATGPATPQQPADPFGAFTQNLMQNPAIMQQMLGLFGGSGEPGSAGTAPLPGGGAPPLNPLTLFGGTAPAVTAPPQPEQPRDTRPPEERYEEQLRQLNEMGFYEFDRNVEALRRTGGNVQGAVDYLLTH